MSEPGCKTMLFSQPGEEKKHLNQTAHAHICERTVSGWMAGISGSPSSKKELQILSAGKVLIQTLKLK